MVYQVDKKTKTYRFLEILPGLVSWFLILFPVWGSFVIPNIVAYYIITFNVYWLYKSGTIGILSVVSYFRIKANQRYDWMKDVDDFGDFLKVHHIVIIPNYTEPIRILKRTLESLANQTFPTKNIHVVLGFEEREGEEAKKKAKILKQEFGDKFGTLLCTYHPILANEVVGKSSNMAWAGKMAKKEIVEKKGLDINYCTITSEDVDARFDRQHFAALTYKFLDEPERYYRFWQPAILYYNNIWDIPAPIRVFATSASITQIAQLNRKDRLINFSTYSASLKLIDSVGYWDTDVIPEDYRIFFKTYFATDGKIEVEPIFLPVYADAAQSPTFKKTMKNQYEQVKRWAWGTSDDPWIIMQWLHAKKIPFWEKTIRVVKVIEDHFLWPVYWFAITIGATLPPLLNSDFARTILGKRLPQTSSFILTLATFSLILSLIFDWIQRPEKHKVSLKKKILSPFEFILMPIIGLFFNALPGLDAHTRLMLGKYIEYKTTEKV